MKKDGLWTPPYNCVFFNDKVNFSISSINAEIETLLKKSTMRAMVGDTIVVLRHCKTFYLLIFMAR